MTRIATDPERKSLPRMSSHRVARRRLTILLTRTLHMEARGLTQRKVLKASSERNPNPAV